MFERYLFDSVEGGLLKLEKADHVCSQVGQKNSCSSNRSQVLMV